MNMQEITRLIVYLEGKGWTDKEIKNILLYVSSGDDRSGVVKTDNQ